MRWALRGRSLGAGPGTPARSGTGRGTRGARGHGVCPGAPPTPSPCPALWRDAVGGSSELSGAKPTGTASPGFRPAGEAWEKPAEHVGCLLLADHPREVALLWQGPLPRRSKKES